jgi:hypothetical protein
MNDLTKEELTTINYLVDTYCQYSQPPEGVYATLKSKVQSMIDNYCEFKVGDPIWWFEGPDQNIFLNASELELKNYIILSTDDSHYWLSDKNSGLTKNSKFYFKSKQEAINAMIKRLEELT